MKNFLLKASLSEQLKFYFLFFASGQHKLECVHLCVSVYSVCALRVRARPGRFLKFFLFAVEFSMCS